MPIAEQPKNKSAYAADNYHKKKKEEREVWFLWLLKNLEKKQN
jgi:hypothetical protein